MIKGATDKEAIKQKIKENSSKIAHKAKNIANVIKAKNQKELTKAP